MDTQLKPMAVLVLSPSLAKSSVTGDRAGKALLHPRLAVGGPILGDLPDTSAVAINL